MSNNPEWEAKLTMLFNDLRDCSNKDRIREIEIRMNKLKILKGE